MASKPVLIARARVNPNDHKRWVTVGAAFRAQFENGPGLSVQLQALPFNWDGSFVLKPPLPDEEPPDDQAGDQRE